MSLLESVISNLIKKNNQVMRQIEQSDGIEKLTNIINERDSGPEATDSSQQANVA